MAIIRVEEQVSPPQYSSGQPFQYNIPNLDFTVTAIDFVLTANVTTGATPGTTQDWIWRLVRNLSVTFPGGTILQANDLRPLHYENKVRFGDAFATGSAPGASATGFVRRARLRVQMGVNPANPFDLSGGIPQGTNNVSISGTWGTATNLGSGYTVNAGTQLSFTLLGLQGASPVHVAPKALPLISIASVSPTSNDPNYNVYWPTRYFLHSQLLMAAVGTYPSDNRSDTAIGNVRLVLPFQSQAQRFSATWDTARALNQPYHVFDDDGTTFGVPTISTEQEVGVVYVPVHKLALGGDPQYGARLQSANETDYATQLNVLNNSNLAVWTLNRQYKQLSA